MAYARFGEDSDVYVFQTHDDRYACMRCPTGADVFYCATPREMVEHLLREHRAKGKRVPDDAIEELLKETGE